VAESFDCTWVITTGAAGMRSQALGLAEAVGLPIVEKQIAGGSLWSQVAERFPPFRTRPAESDLLPPWPRLVIACGQRSAGSALAVKRSSDRRTLTVYVQDPGFGSSRFDLVVAMPHDRLSGPNVTTVATALHQVTPERLRLAAEEWRARLAPAHAPLLGVLVGGNSGNYRLTSNVIAQLLGTLHAARAAHGVHVIVSPSRRTGPDAAAALADGLAGTNWATVWRGDGPNPYFGILALSDRLVVTGESISMISEALATGRPVHVIRLEGRGRRHEEFLSSMVDGRTLSVISDGVLDWTFAGVPALDSTTLVAEQIKAMLRARA
jgi:mitochondrial fission protein ELM1